MRQREDVHHFLKHLKCAHVVETLPQKKRTFYFIVPPVVYSHPSQFQNFLFKLNKEEKQKK